MVMLVRCRSSGPGASTETALGATRSSPSSKRRFLLHRTVLSARR
jgi:hypothetical protein